MATCVLPPEHQYSSRIFYNTHIWGVVKSFSHERTRQHQGLALMYRRCTIPSVLLSFFRFFFYLLLYGSSSASRLCPSSTHPRKRRRFFSATALTTSSTAPEQPELTLATPARSSRTKPCFRYANCNAHSAVKQIKCSHVLLGPATNTRHHVSPPTPL